MVLASSLFPSFSFELFDEAESLLVALLQLSHAGKWNRLVVWIFLIIRTDFKMSRNLRDASHVP